MSWNFIGDAAIAKGNRYEWDLELQSGSIIAVRNRDYSYGEVKYWGAVAALDYNLLGGNDPLLHNEKLLYQKSHSFQMVSPVGSTVQPSIYSPQGYRLEYLTFALYLWMPE